MKITLLSNKKPPAIDGVGDYSTILVDLLQREFQVDHITRDELRQRRWSMGSLFGLVKQIKSEDGRYCILQYVPYSYQSKGLPFNIVFFSFLLKLYNIPLIVFFHEVAIRPKGLKYGLISAGQRLIANLLLIISRGSFTSISFYRKNFARPLRRKLAVAHIPSNFEFVAISPTSETNKMLSVSCLANRLQDEALKWIAEFQSQFDVMEYHIIGKPDPAVRLPSSPHVTYIIHESLSDDDFKSVLSRCTIYLQLDRLVNRTEGGASFKSGALAANMQMGKIIITNCGDMTDSKLVNGQNIFFANHYKTARELAKEITDLLGDREQLYGFQQNVSRCYEDTLSWRNHVKKYLSILNNVSDRNSE